MHGGGGGGGRILDQLHHAVAQHHLAGRDSDIAADREPGLLRGAGGSLPQILGQVLAPVLPGQQRRGWREPARGFGQQGVGLRVETIRWRRA